MNWAEISIETKTEGIEILTGFLMVHGVNCVMIEDAEDFNSFLNDTTIYWDYVDDELMKLKELLDTGVITKEEFDKHKSSLL